jgi:hypothetical protein
VKTTRATLLLVVVEQVTADEAPSAAPAIETTAELVRARPIRNVRPEAVDGFRPKSPFARLDNWIKRCAS